ncbi:MAG: lysophospholipid acyltransferase family protein [Burkholderiaceae bacterium]
MMAFRSSLYAVLQLVTVAPWSIICLLAAVLPLEQRYRVTMVWTRFCIWLADKLLGIKYQVKGTENMPTGPAILLSKHQSTWETLFYPGFFLPRELCYVFKRELLMLPFFGWGIGLLKMIHIDRKKGSGAFEEVVAQGKEKLAEGRLIIMFPEGTRIPVGQAGKYKSGGARLAVRTGAPIIPIAHNAGECWPRNAFIKKPGLVTVSIGPAIPTEGRDSEEVNNEVQQWIESEMRIISPHIYAAETA